MVNRELVAPCGMYCGVCGVLIAHRDNNQPFKEKLAQFYGCPVEDLDCQGCMSSERAAFCEVCNIRSCAMEKNYEGCYQCDDWPCEYIEQFSVPVGKKVIMRAVPQWREWGTEKWVEEEEKRYICPKCGYPSFRGSPRCRHCKEPLALD